MERRNTEMTLTLRLFLLFNESLDFSAEIANLALFFFLDLLLMQTESPGKGFTRWN